MFLPALVEHFWNLELGWEEPKVKITHYVFVVSGPVHQKADWGSIHEKICQLLIPLRTTMPFYNSEEERQHSLQQQQKRQASPMGGNSEGGALVFMFPVTVPFTGSSPLFSLSTHCCGLLGGLNKMPQMGWDKFRHSYSQHC